MDTDLTASDIASRLARLENSNRRLRAALGGVVLGGVALVLAAAARGGAGADVDEVVARRLRIVDEAGATYVEISADDARSQLTMRARGHGTVWLSATCSPSGGAKLALGPHLDCLTGETPSHATLTATKSGARCETTTWDQEGGRSNSVGLESSLDGRARFELSGGREHGGEILFEAGERFGPAATFTADGDDRVRIRAASAMRASTGAVESRPTPFIALTGGDGATVELRPVDGSGK